MKKKVIFGALVLSCILLCACSQRDTAFESSESSAISSQAEEIEESLDSSSPISSDSSSEEPIQELNRLEIDLPIHGAPSEYERQSKQLILSCPPDWESLGDGNIDRENKKLIEINCYTPERKKDWLESIDDKKDVVIGDRTFQVFSEEYGILENEPQKQVVPYIIWKYYYFDGELYYSFAFFQNQQTMPVTLDEFERVLATLEIKEN